MHDEEVLKLHKVLESPTTKMPKIQLQRIEEIFPSLKEGLCCVHEDFMSCFLIV